MKKQFFLSGVCLVLVLSFIPPAGKAAGSGDDDFHLGQEMRDCGGESCASVARGFQNFLDRKLKDMQGNGRSCADCHMPTDSFQLSPASAEARFQLAQWLHTWNPKAKDPLFLPIDADDFRTNGANASDFSNLRQNGLVRITFPLPSN